MKFYSSLRNACLFILFSAAFIFTGCGGDRQKNKSAYFGEEQHPEPSLQSNDSGEEPPESHQENWLTNRSAARVGIVREDGEFWIGLPNKASSMVLLKLSEHTELKVLSLIDGYYKVEHRNVIGYVEKGLVDLVESTKSQRIAAPDEREIQSNTPQVPARLAKNNKERLPSSVITPCTEISSEELLPGVSCAQYWAKVQEKVSTLENYIKRIIDKSELNRQKSIDLACRLFVNEQARVYTSSVNEGERSRPIRKYLNSLMALNYDRVGIEWTNIQYVSELRKGPDGRYYGNVHIEQKFEGFLDGRLVYGDVTEKKITVILESYEVIDAQGDVATRWDVFLSDIGVEQTQTID